MTSIDVDFYRRLLESSPEGVVLVDARMPEHPVVYVNRCRPTTAIKTRVIACAKRLAKANRAAFCCAITARMARFFGTR